jgi:hypothetical protein
MATTIVKPSQVDEVHGFPSDPDGRDPLHDENAAPMLQPAAASI